MQAKSSTSPVHHRFHLNCNLARSQKSMEQAQEPYCCSSVAPWLLHWRSTEVSLVVTGFEKLLPRIEILHKLSNFAKTLPARHRNTNRGSYV